MGADLPSCADRWRLGQRPMVRKSAKIATHATRNAPSGLAVLASRRRERSKATCRRPRLEPAKRGWHRWLPEPDAQQSSSSSSSSLVLRTRAGGAAGAGEAPVLRAGAGSAGFDAAAGSGGAEAGIGAGGAATTGRGSDTVSVLVAGHGLGLIFGGSLGLATATDTLTGGSGGGPAVTAR